MRKQSGDLHIVDFKTKLVIGVIRAHEYVEDKRHWEIKNSVDILDFKILESSPYEALLQQQNIIIKETRPGVMTPYVITETEKDTVAKKVTIYASGEWTLLAGESYIAPQKIPTMNARQYLAMSLNGSDWSVGNVEATGTHSMTITDFISPLQFNNMIASAFNGYELQYRVIVQGAFIVKKYVDLVEKRGRFTAKEINVGKDLQGIVRKENSEGVITTLIGYVTVKGADGEEKVITVADANGGIPYVVDEEAFQRWSINGKHRFGFYTPETDNQNMTPERLLTLTKMALKKRIDTNVVYEVDAVSLAKLTGLTHETINEGDTVYIKDKTISPPIFLEARAIAADESYKDPRQDKFYFGNYRELLNRDDALQRTYQRILASLQDKVPSEMFNQLQEKVNSQTDAITEAGKKADEAHQEAQTAKDVATEVQSNMDRMQTAIIESPTAPTKDLEAGKTLWLDSSDPTAKILKLWNGTDWEPLVPDTVGITTEITNIKGELGTKVSEKQMQEYIGELGADNLLLNTQFVKKKVNDFGDVTEETPSLERWNPDADAVDRKITVDESKRYKQSRSVKIESTHTTTNVWHGIYQDVPAYQKQGKFQFSAMLYTEDKYAISLGAAFKVEFFNGTTSVGGYKQVEFQDKLVDGQWTRFTIDHDAPDAPITHARIEVWIRRAGTVWVAEPQCNVGEKLPVYMENPKDIVNYDAMVKEVADRVTKSEFNTVNSSYDTKFTQTNQEINLRAKSTDVYTKDEGDGRYGSKAVVDRHDSELKVNAQEISLRVKDNEIAAKLNLTAQTALVQAQKIHLDGYVEAKHIKTGSLKGVVIMTEDPSSTNNHMRLEKQNLTLFGSGKSRGYLGFVPTTDGSFTEALVLGNDYSGAGGNVNDALVFDHTTPSLTNYASSVASIGVASGRDSSGKIAKHSYLSFERYDYKTTLQSKGGIDLNASADIYINASHLGSVRARAKGYNFLNVASDTFIFSKERTQISNDFIIKLDDTANLEAVATTYHNMHIKVHKGTRNKEGFYFLERYDPADGIYTVYANVNCKNLWAAFDVSGVTWTQRSTREIKADIQAIQSDEVDALMLLKPSQYFLNKDVEEYGIEYLREHSSDFLQYGFVAEETPEQFQGRDKRSVVPYSLITVNIAATQQIMLRQNEQQKEINCLKEQNIAQEERISKLEALVQQLLAN
ncbi:Phage minor structural protein [Bacillus pseudomycoides]|uniref:phage tail spike protein n=1 Tax=Bacillus pseudomycoides TaxID=64104 RepID=UPI0001A1545D|nr:phage tail spike protein [Bacillus pseudomycoides]EEM02225.1 Phage minor structural protein [Bacillus pseudomycoides]PGC40871.1 peptidase S74 [Bacillus pseudomycoides]